MVHLTTRLVMLWVVIAVFLDRKETFAQALSQDGSEIRDVERGLCLCTCDNSQGVIQDRLPSKRNPEITTLFRTLQRLRHDA